MSSEGKSLQRGVSMLESGFLLNDGAGKKGILLPLPCSAGKRLARLLKPSDNTNGTSLPPLSKGVKGERSDPLPGPCSPGVNTLIATAQQRFAFSSQRAAKPKPVTPLPKPQERSFTLRQTLMFYSNTTLSKLSTKYLSTSLIRLRLFFHACKQKSVPSQHIMCLTRMPSLDQQG